MEGDRARHAVCWAAWVASGASLQPAHLNRGEGSRAVVGSVGRRLGTGGEAEVPGQAAEVSPAGKQALLD